ncbi:unnamed protein product [Symbiodinium sp. KB8]|nr:unnamed protein product [Symbiodinium sp. KB8]
MGFLEATDGDYLNGKFVNFAASYAGDSTQGRAAEIMQDRVTRIIRDAAGVEGTSTVDVSNVASYGSSSSRTWQGSSYDTQSRSKGFGGSSSSRTWQGSSYNAIQGASKVLELPGSSATEASTLEMDEDVVEGLDFASQFSPLRNREAGEVLQLWRERTLCPDNSWKGV